MRTYHKHGEVFIVSSPSSDDSLAEAREEEGPSGLVSPLFHLSPDVAPLGGGVQQPGESPPAAGRVDLPRRPGGGSEAGGEPQDLASFLTELKRKYGLELDSIRSPSKAIWQLDNPLAGESPNSSERATPTLAGWPSAPQLPASLPSPQRAVSPTAGSTTPSPAGNKHILDDPVCVASAAVASDLLADQASSTGRQQQQQQHCAAQQEQQETPQGHPPQAAQQEEIEATCMEGGRLADQYASDEEEAAVRQLLLAEQMQQQLSSRQAGDSDTSGSTIGSVGATSTPRSEAAATLAEGSVPSAPGSDRTSPCTTSFSSCATLGPEPAKLEWKSLNASLLRAGFPPIFPSSGAGFVEAAAPAQDSSLVYQALDSLLREHARLCTHMQHLADGVQGASRREIQVVASFNAISGQKNAQLHKWKRLALENQQLARDAQLASAHNSASTQSLVAEAKRLAGQVMQLEHELRSKVGRVQVVDAQRCCRCWELPVWQPCLALSHTFLTSCVQGEEVEKLKHHSTAQREREQRRARADKEAYERLKRTWAVSRAAETPSKAAAVVAAAVKELRPTDICRIFEAERANLQEELAVTRAENSVREGQLQRAREALHAVGVPVDGAEELEGQARVAARQAAAAEERAARLAEEAVALRQDLSVRPTAAQLESLQRQVGCPDLCACRRSCKSWWQHVGGGAAYAGGHHGASAAESSSREGGSDNKGF